MLERAYFTAYVRVYFTHTYVHKMRKQAQSQSESLITRVTVFYPIPVNGYNCISLYSLSIPDPCRHISSALIIQIDFPLVSRRPFYRYYRQIAELSCHGQTYRDSGVTSFSKIILSREKKKRSSTFLSFTRMRRV